MPPPLSVTPVPPAAVSAPIAHLAPRAQVAISLMTLMSASPAQRGLSMTLV